jgi:hypothetical protein
MTHVPTPMKLTVDPVMEQNDAADGSMENVTELPDPPPVADTV